MSKFTWPVLLGTAGVGLLCTGAMGMVLGQKVTKVLNKSNYVQDAIFLTREQPTVRELVGDNMMFGVAKVDGSEQSKEKIQIKLPFGGKNDQAFLTIHARKQEKSDKFRLFKLEAEFSKIKGKKLLILDRSSEDQSTDEKWAEALSAKREAHAETVRKKSPAELARMERERIKNMSDKERKEYYLQKMKEMEPK